MTMKFSVVIPYFNDIEFIEQCLNSVVNQTYNFLEVILVDDCSDDSDELKSLIEEKYNKKIDIKYIRNTTNKNGAYSRNLGVSLSDGDYICFLDADDYWVKNKLDTVNKFIVNNKLGENDVLYSKVSILTRDGISSSRPERAISKGSHMSEYLFLEGGFVQTSSLIVPKALTYKVVFDPRFKRHQDYQYCIELHHHAAFHFIDESLVVYRAMNGIYSKKLEDLDYCMFWLSEMKGFMTKDGYYGYLLFPYNARLLGANKYGSVIGNTIKCLSKISLKGYYSSLFKLKSVICSHIIG